MPFAAAIPLIAAGITAVGNLFSQHKQNKANRKLAQFQADQDRLNIDRANRYNSPASQMLRYQDAGLNKNLIYGQGSPGNQTAAQKYPDIRPTDYKNLMDGVLPAYNQSRLADSQVQAQNASTLQKYAMAEVNKVQAEVLRRNPLLDNAGFTAIIDGLKAAATLKQEQSVGQHLQNKVTDMSSGHIVNKLYHEVELLEQRFKLGQQDSKIKAEILTSKEFNNAILEVQKKFMTDGEVTPQHILQFIQLILMKAL